MDGYQVQTPMSQARPSTAGLIELHVYLVPEELWNPKLNKVSTDVIWRFVSLGFIRAPPDLKLQTLREHLSDFLGEDTVAEKFVFLKYVGSSLAVVKTRQEPELKLKLFAPPYAREPELYLLPGGHNENSTYGSTVTPDQNHYHTDFSGSDHSTATVTAPAWEQPLTRTIDQSNVAAPKPAQEDDVRRSYIWNRKGQVIVPLSSQIQYKVQTDEGGLLSVSSDKFHTVAIKNIDVADTDDPKKLPGRNTTGDSGIEHSLLGAETDDPPKKRQERQAKPVNREPRNKEDKFGGASFRHLPEPAHYQPPPSPPILPDFPTIKSPKPQISSRDKTVAEQLNQVREERIQLEKSREELMRRAKTLLEQHKLKRQQARDSWKKKYFETKKVTASLEEAVQKLKSDLELRYQKLLTQLAARDSKQHAKHPSLAASSKNSVIMTITTKQHELDQLKRKLENARIKLLIEIKMRKQASADLNVLKAELAQKKAQSGLNHPPLFMV